MADTYAREAMRRLRGGNADSGFVPGYAGMHTSSHTLHFPPCFSHQLGMHTSGSMPQQLSDHIALESQPEQMSLITSTQSSKLPRLHVQSERLPERLPHKKRHRIRPNTVPAKDLTVC